MYTILFYWISNEYSYKRIYFYSLVLTLLLFFFTIFLSAISKAKVKDSNYAIIFSPVAKVMTAPSVNSSTTYQLHEGSKAKITGESDQWYEISFNERKGWIEKIFKENLMNKSEKVQFVINELERLYPKTPIPLDHKDPYTLLIAVLLSAQCTDERVNKITPILFKKADNPFEMVKLKVEEIKAIIRPCGLSPRKSKAIHELSSILINKYDGKVPNNMLLLEELPGVGHKTASVVMSQVFGEPAFPVDTHIHRLMYRWGFSNGKNVVQTEKDAKRLFPKNFGINFIYKLFSMVENIHQQEVSE